MPDPFVIECPDATPAYRESGRFEDPAAAPLVIGDPVSGAILSAIVDDCPAHRHRPLWRALASRWLAPSSAA
jgi:hypothetical protein